MTREKAFELITKLLATASDKGASENEAITAALRAQELMAKYHLSMSDIDIKDNEIDEIYLEVGLGNKWKYQLARIVANNFCCQYFLCGKDTIVFYGHKVDIKIATDVFWNLFTVGNQLAGKEYRDAKFRGEYTVGLVNSWLSGYLAGIKSVLDAQCTALMIVVPQDVENEYVKRSAEGLRRIRAGSAKDTFPDSCCYLQQPCKVLFRHAA